MSERPPEAPPGEQAPTPPGSTPTEPLPTPPGTTPTEPLPASPAAAPTHPLPPAATATQTLPPPPGPASGPPPGYAGPQPNPRAGRRLVRRTDQRVIAGVAGGIADYLGLEPWLVRIAFVVLVPFGGFGALAYLIAWLLVPPAGTEQSLAAGVLRRPPTGFRGYLGVALILLAVAILASAFSEPQVIWAVALIAFGIFLFRQDDPQPPDGPPPSGGGGTDPAAATATLPAVPPAATTTEPLGQPPASAAAIPVAPAAPVAPATSAASAAAAEPTTLPPPDLPVWSQPPPPPPPAPAAAWGAPPPRRPRRRAFLGPLTFAAALIATGVALALDNLHVLDLSVGQLLAVFLTVLGAGLLVGTWWGRAWGLIPVGLLAVPVVAVTALAGNVPVEGGVAERLYQPTTPAQVRSSYRLAGGEMILDLSKVKFPAGAPPVQASVAGGRLLVVLPDEVAAEVRGRVGVGSLDLLGHEDAGSQVDSTIVEPAVKPHKEGTAPMVRLDLRSGYGVIEVRRISDPRGFHDVGPFDEQLNPPPAPATERS
jgi:phage shock protein PspC (stress-responsive transcriptional regulator)